MFTAPQRALSFPLDRAVEMTVTTPAGEEICGLPEFPLDSDEKITVLFRFSLNEFVAIASAVDAGVDLAYGADAQKVWWLWAASVMCAQFCEEMALCLTNENPAVVAALANLIATNPDIWAALSSAMSELGYGVPGQPLNENQKQADTLPDNVKDEFGDCELDPLYGAMLFLVQRGNRAIVDFFEIIEEQTNALEASAIVSGAIPAAGPYAEAGFQFADQLLENITEGYAAAYTEEYEIGLACELFCIARATCTLTPDILVQVMQLRLAMPSPQDFGDVMSGIGGAIFPGTSIPDSAFYIYFSALMFGQKFGDTIGYKPLTDQMALGAEQLASNAWEIECDCPSGVIFKVYADFMQTIFVEDVDVELGVEFDLVIAPGDFPYGEIVLRPQLATNWRLTYTASGTISPTLAESAWSYRKPDDEFESETPGILTDMPSPADGNIWFWNNAESLDGTATYTLHITIDVLP